MLRPYAMRSLTIKKSLLMSSVALFIGLGAAACGDDGGGDTGTGGPNPADAAGGGATFDARPAPTVDAQAAAAPTE